MTSRGDKVEQSMNTVVPESWIALDPRFFSEDVIVLALKISDNLGETVHISSLIASQYILWGMRDGPCFVVYLVTKARSVDDSQ